MRNWIGKIMCIVAALAVADVPMLLVQGVAWTTMIQTRAPEMGVVDALDSTFGGEEPCSLCCVVQQKKKEQQEEAPVPETQTMAKWIPCASSGEVCVIRPHILFLGMRPTRLDCFSSRSELPECPPPQLVS